MAPKARAAAAKKRPAGETEVPDKAARVEAGVTKSKARAPKDEHHKGGGRVYQDEDGINWAVSLNQTNLGANNNKFYILQLIENHKPGVYNVHTRWGRCGDIGQMLPAGKELLGTDLANMKKQFAQKFKDKTKNDWNTIRQDHTQFKKVADKYQLIETFIEEEEDDSTAAAAATDNNNKKQTKAVAGAAAASSASGAAKKCTLPQKVQDVLNIILDHDMFKDQMKQFQIDPKKMPLGQLTKSQIEAGYKSLEAIETAINNKKRNNFLEELSSNFYTLIPHECPRHEHLEVINRLEQVEEKYELLDVLNDIEIAVSLSKRQGSQVDDHPLDRQYKQIGCGISYIDPKKDAEEFDVIQTFLKNTGSADYQKSTITNAYRIDRPEDKSRISKYSKETNRKLLVHGTNISVVAAILGSGLRIMPHSGGRVGRGLYFADMFEKSQGYTRCDKNVGFMFLVEVVLGDAKEINKDDSSLDFKKVEQTMKKDSIIARGRIQPDPKKDIQIDGEWQKITVPQGKAIDSEYKKTGTSFHHSEYLVYNEDRVRIKYALQMKFERPHGW